jgi:hypothetical protein
MIKVSRLRRGSTGVLSTGERFRIDSDSGRSHRMATVWGKRMETRPIYIHAIATLDDEINRMIRSS